MDFKNVPNTTSYPIAPPAADEFGGGISSGAMNPQAYAGATLNTDTPAPKKSNAGVYVGIFAAFAVMTASSIGFFMYLNGGQSARASSNENQYAALLSQTPVPQSQTGTSPIPTIDLGSFAVTLTPTPAPKITIFPTLPNNVATYTPTPAVTITPIRGNKWAISYNKMTYTPKDVSNNSGVGTLYTPIEYGKTFCTDQSNTFFTWKKDASTIERLCDRLTPTSVVPQLVCNKSSPSGTAISAKLLPTTDCYGSKSSTPPYGTYVMYTKVYYDCDEKQPVQSATTCKSTKEIFSDDFNFSMN